MSEVRRSQVKVTTRLHMVIWAFWETFPHLPGMCGHILIKLLAVTHYRGVNVTLMTFWRSRVERSRSPITFCHRHTDGWFAVEDHSVLPSVSLPKGCFFVFWYVSSYGIKFLMVVSLIASISAVSCLQRFHRLVWQFGHQTLLSYSIMASSQYTCIAFVA